MADEQKQPIPTDEIASLAGRVLARRKFEDEVVKSGTAVASESYNELLADAKKFAGFVLNADPHEGANAG